MAAGRAAARRSRSWRAALGVSRASLRAAITRARGGGPRRARVHGSGTYVTRPAAAAQRPRAQLRRAVDDRLRWGSSRARSSEAVAERAGAAPGSAEALGVERGAGERAAPRAHRRRAAAWSYSGATASAPGDAASRRARCTRRLRRGRHPPRRRHAATGHRRPVPGRLARRRGGRAAARAAAGRLRRADQAVAGRRRSTTWPTPSTSRSTGAGPAMRTCVARHRRRLPGHLRAGDRRRAASCWRRLRGHDVPTRAPGWAEQDPRAWLARARPDGGRGDGRRRPVAHRGAVVRRAARRPGVRRRRRRAAARRDHLDGPARRRGVRRARRAGRSGASCYAIDAAATSTAATSARRSPGSAAHEPETVPPHRAVPAPRLVRGAWQASGEYGVDASNASSSMLVDVRAPRLGTRAPARRSASTRRALAPVVPPHGVLGHDRALAARGDRAARRGAGRVRLRRRDGRDARRRRRRARAPSAT